MKALDTIVTVQEQAAVTKKVKPIVTVPALDIIVTRALAVADAKTWVAAVVELFFAIASFARVRLLVSS